MSFFKKIRAAYQISVAGSLIDNTLQVEYVVGSVRPREGTRRFAERLVVSLWQSIPALANGREIPSAPLLAVAALASGAKLFEERHDRCVSGALSRCLDVLLLNEILRKLEPSLLTGVDADLYAIAVAGYDLSPAPWSKESKDLLMPPSLLSSNEQTPSARDLGEILDSRRSNVDANARPLEPVGDFRPGRDE